MLSVGDFGAELLRTNDLDPVYVLLHSARLRRPVLLRWLLAYWGFYHVGTASWITQHYLVGSYTSDVRYWQAMMTAANSKDYPRSSERRHYRAKNAINSVEYLKAIGIDALFEPFLEGRLNTCKAVSDYVKTWVGFGPWIAFKVADMLERLAICPVRFEESDALYESPREGAELLWREAGKGEPTKETGSWGIAHVLRHVAESLGNRKRIEHPTTQLTPSLLLRQGRVYAPPRYERPINAQEAETVLCKYKSYRNGHYELGEDVEACKKGLEMFAYCGLSKRLLTAGRQEGLWS